MRSSALVILLLSALVSNGCVVAVAAAAAAATYGAIRYSENGAEQDFQTDLDTTFAAARDAMIAAGHEVAEDVAPATTTEGELVGDDVTVRVERHAGAITRVIVRVGAFETDDNQRRARLLLEDIATRLEAD